MKTPTFIIALLLFFGTVQAQYHFVYDSATKDVHVFEDTGKSINKVDTFKCLIGFVGYDGKEHWTDGFSIHGHYLTWTGHKWIRSDQVAYLDANLKLVTAKILHHVDAAGQLHRYHRHNDSTDFRQYYKPHPDPCVIDTAY